MLVIVGCSLAKIIGWPGVEADAPAADHVAPFISQFANCSSAFS
jgi:hypothetical protein